MANKEMEQRVLNEFKNDSKYNIMQLLAIGIEIKSLLFILKMSNLRTFSRMKKMEDDPPLIVPPRTLKKKPRENSKSGKWVKKKTSEVTAGIPPMTRTTTV